MIIRSKSLNKWDLCGLEIIWKWRNSSCVFPPALQKHAHQVWFWNLICWCKCIGRSSFIRSLPVLLICGVFLDFLPAPAIFKSICYIDVRWFPFDVQECDLKFGSWTYDSRALDLQMMEAVISSYTPNGEWDLIGKRDQSIRSPQRFVSGLFFCQRSKGKWPSRSTNAARRRTLTSRSRWWCGDGPSTTESTCSSHVSWSVLWLYWSLFCQLTLGRRSHWVRNTHTRTYRKRERWHKTNN